MTLEEYFMQLDMFDLYDQATIDFLKAEVELDKGNDELAKEYSEAKLAELIQDVQNNVHLDLFDDSDI